MELWYSRFPDEAKLRQAFWPDLDRIALIIEAVWSAAQTAGRYSELASEVADLELRLMDSRISGSGTRLSWQAWDGANPRDAIARHVEGVLQPAATGLKLEQLSKGLEEEVEERRPTTNRAKAILQSAYGMSEEQAHAHLRQISRKTRRKLKDVAVDLIERHPEGVKQIV